MGVKIQLLFSGFGGLVVYQYIALGLNKDSKIKSSPVTGLEWSRGFQEVKVPRFLDNSAGWW
jgi:hypothetical protein